MTDPTAQRNFIHIDGLSVAEAITGDPAAPPVVMLHGWGVSLDLVWPLAKQLAPLGYRVLALDMPGFGESDPPPQAWSVHDYVRFVLAYLDFHRLERVHLFGHSFGGRLGLVLGADHAERLRTMVLADAAGLHKRAPIHAQLRLRAYKAVRDNLKTVGLISISDRLRHAYNRRYGSSDFQAVSGVMRETFINVVNEDLRHYARRVAVPTLLLWGDQDGDTPLEQGQLLEQLIPDAGLVVYEGAGHYSYLERTAQVVRAIDALFNAAD
jgi:pimeloyl-ACP methyl ester carboxylesterase